MLSLKSRKQGQKIKKTAQIFDILVFVYGHYPTDIKIGSKWPLHVLKQAEMQSKTRGVHSFGAKSGASAANLIQKSK